MKTSLFTHGFQTSICCLGMIMLLSITVLVSCSDDDSKQENIPVNSVSLSPSELTLSIDETSQLIAVISPENASNQIATWISSDPSVASVSSKGLVTALSAGTTTITVNIDNHQASCRVMVEAEAIQIEGNKANINLNAFTTNKDITEAISQADKAGITEYILTGDFSKLGIGNANTKSTGNTHNPFAGTQVEKINMEGVTGWPAVTTEYNDDSDALQGIPASSFYDEDGEIYPNLRLIIFPAEVKVIGDAAFYGCRRIQQITFPGVTIIGKEAFYDCQTLTEAKFPEVVIVGEDAFFNCCQLLEVDFPKAEQLHEDAFNSCLILEKVNLPKARFIGDHVFSYDFCEKVMELTLPEAKTISKNAFYDCEKLTKLSLPKAKTIGDFAFHKCEMLSTLELTSNEAISLSDGTFDDFETSHCNLILNGNKKGETMNNNWRNFSWLSISFK